MITYSALVDEILTAAFPRKMPQNLVSLRQRHVLSGLIDLQTKIESLQAENKDVHQGEGKYRCGAMVLQAPYGILKRVEAFRSTDDATDVAGNEDSPECQCLVTYALADQPYIQAISRDYVNAGGKMTDDAGIINQVLPVPYGFFAVRRDELWAYPATLSPWRLRVVWQGIKQDYEAADELDLTESQKDLLRAYVTFKARRDEDCFREAEILEAEYNKLVRQELNREWDRLHPAATKVYHEASRNGWPRCGPACRVTEDVAYVEPSP